MIKSIVIDDEQHCIDRIQRLLATHCADDIQQLSPVSDIETAHRVVQQEKPDVLFLDIQIGQDTGFDLLGMFTETDFDVVFTTAYEHYALQAFKFSATDYLLKPVDVDDLLGTVGRLIEKRRQSPGMPDLGMLMQNLAFSQQQSKKVAIPTLTGFSLVSVGDIVRCRSEVNYTIIYMRDNTELMVAKTLKEFEIMLTPYGFARIHNSHLVNLDFIRHYHKGKGGYVILDDGSEIEVSVRRKEVLLESLYNL